MKLGLKVRRYINVLLTATLPFLCAAIFTLPNLFMGQHWGPMNWLMQPLATLSLVLAPVAWIIFVVMGISWAQGSKLHKSIPIIGLAVGPISIMPWVVFVIPVILMLPAIILAVRLVMYHLGGQSNELAG